MIPVLSVSWPDLFIISPETYSELCFNFVDPVWHCNLPKQLKLCAHSVKCKSKFTRLISLDMKCVWPRNKWDIRICTFWDVVSCTRIFAVLKERTAFPQSIRNNTQSSRMVWIFTGLVGGLIQEDGHHHDYQHESLKSYKYDAFYMKSQAVPTYMTSLCPVFPSNRETCMGEGGDEWWSPMKTHFQPFCNSSTCYCYQCLLCMCC
jgi:hypothetical protein